MRRITVSITVALSFLATSAAFADAYGDLMKAQTAFLNARSWHAEEHFSDGRTITIEAPAS